MPTLAPQLLRSRLGKLCVAITGSTPDELLERASAAIKETSFLEFRLDYLPKPVLALASLKTFLAENGSISAIATCRRSEFGGRFEGSVSAEIDILSKAAEAGFQIVDLAVEAAELAKTPELERLREAGAALLISYHDFSATRDLDKIYQRIQPFHPDFIKIVPTARTLTDNVTLIRFLERVADTSSIVGICMGDAGIISRVLGLRAGSLFTFAAATAGEETAPGQITARTLLETYRIDQVDAATKVYGVAGNPIRSSLSPIMMNTAFRRETLNAVYLALQTTKLSDLLELVQQIPLQGLSVTMPLKQEILSHLARTDPLSAKIGACNTVLRAADGNLYGFNTDVAGIIGPLEKRTSLSGTKCLVLGAGGAARAAVFGLRDKGADVFILNRTPETAQKLAKQSGSKTIKKDALAKSSFDIIINATPIGMSGVKAAPLLYPEGIKARLVFDLVYNPVETPLLRLARQQNIPVITGVEMFVQQGARQFEIWTGKPAPEEEMLRVVLHALRQQAEATTATRRPSQTSDSDASTPESHRPADARTLKPEAKSKPAPPVETPKKARLGKVS